MDVLLGGRWGSYLYFTDSEIRHKEDKVKMARAPNNFGSLICDALD